MNDGRCANAFAFDEGAVASPLPRAYQWADGSAYVNHVELVRRARGAQMPKTFWTEPLMYQGGSDDFIGPHDDIVAGDESWGIDLEGELAVVTDDVAMGTSPAQAGSHIKLLMLVNDVSLRGLIPGELDKGFGFFQSKPASAFSPVAVTPDELGDAWDGGRVHLPLLAFVNDAPFGHPDAGVDMVFDFCELVAHASRTRNLCAGTIIGSGTVSNRQDLERGTSIADGGVGYTCIAEIRTIETIRTGAPVTPFLRYGDSVRLEMRDGARPVDLRFDLAARRAAEARHVVIHVDPSPAERRRGALSSANRERVVARDAARRRAGARSGDRARAARRVEAAHGPRLARTVGVLRQRRRQSARPRASAAGSAADGAVRVCGLCGEPADLRRAAGDSRRRRVLRVLQRQHQLSGQHVSAAAPRRDACAGLGWRGRSRRRPWWST